MIPVILAIDLEPDAVFVDPSKASPWSGCAPAFAFIEELRGLAKAELGTKAAFTWALRMDPQVSYCYGSADYVVRTFGRQLAAVESRGDELGLHTHFFRWIEATKSWRIDQGDAAWVAHCHRESFSAFRRSFSRDCATYRGGDRWHDDASVRLVEELGTRFDLTPERGEPAIRTIRPGADVSGSIADYTGLPNRPYHPSQQDFRVPNPGRDRQLWMIPLSGGRMGFQRNWRPEWMRKAVDFVDPHRRIKAFYSPYACRLWADVAHFRRQFDAYRLEPGFSYVALAVRSSSFVQQRERNNIVANLTYMMSALQKRGMEFCTPEEMLATLNHIDTVSEIETILST